MGMWGIAVGFFLGFIMMISFIPNVDAEPQIVISGETNPIVVKGISKLYHYEVEVVGDIKVDGYLERCWDSSCNKITKITDSSRIYSWDEDFQIYFGYATPGVYFVAELPETISYFYKFGDASAELVIHPIFEERKLELEISEESFQKIHTKSAQVMDWFAAKMENRWFMNIEICSGEQSLIKPTILIISDIEKTPFTLDKAINALSCARQQIQVKAIDPNSVKVNLEKFEFENTLSQESISDLSVLQRENTELKQEISDLKEKLEKKDALLMEQLKVISDLATMIKQTIFEPIMNYFAIA